MKSCFLILCAAYITQHVEAKTVLSSLIPVCDARDPELDNCALNSANKIMPFFSKGIRDYGFVPLDPLKVPKMDIGQDTGPVTLKLELIDTTHTGMGTLKFNTAKIDLDKGHMVFNGTLEQYTLEGKYIGKGRILLVPIVGDGRANFTLENTGIDIVVDGAPSKNKAGVTYFKLSNLRVYMKFDVAYMSLTNLFNGNKQLGETTNKFLNENALEVFNGLKGTLQDVYSSLYFGLLSRFTNSVPYNQLFKNV